MENGVMKLEQNYTDVATYLWTGSLNFSKGVTMERDVYLHADNSYYAPEVKYMFDNKKLFLLRYMSEAYSGYYNFTIGDDINVETILPVETASVLDKWFREKITVSPNGKLRYYLDGTFIGEYDVSSATSGAASFKIRFSPSGWWTGHKHYFDNFSISGN